MTNLSEITRLRAEEKALRRANSLTALRTEFDKKKREEWQRIKENYDAGAVEVQIAALRQQMARIAVQLREEGVSKTLIGEAYGSKDRRTIDMLLDSAIAEGQETYLTLEPSFEEDGRLPVWRIHATNYDGWTGTVTVYADEDGDPVIYGDLPNELRGTKLHQEIAGGATGDFSSAWSQAL